MKVLAAVGVFVSGVLVVVIAYWLLWPMPVFQPFTAEIQVLTPEVRPGQQLLYSSTSCKIKSVRCTVSRSFVDGVIYTAPTVEGTYEMGCNERTVAVPVPNLPTGGYHLHGVVSCQVNPLRFETYEFDTTGFHIVPRIVTPE